MQKASRPRGTKDHGSTASDAIDDTRARTRNVQNLQLDAKPAEERFARVGGRKGGVKGEGEKKEDGNNNFAGQETRSERVRC